MDLICPEEGNYRLSAALVACCAVCLLAGVGSGCGRRLPDLSITIGDSKLGADGNVSASLKIVALITALSFCAGA